jgi:hypothetical protein
MAPGGKAQQALRAQKDARQKKVLFVLGPLFLALVAWQGPGMLKAFSGGEAPPPAPQAAPTSTAPDPTVGGAPSTATGEAAPVTGGVAELPEGDEPYEPGAGQLVSFDRFVGKDPFRQQVSAKTDEGASGGAPSGTDDDTGGTPPDAGGGSFDGGNGGNGANGGGGGGGGGDDGGAPSSATLTVNGVSQVVVPDGTFPVQDPIFELVSISSSSVRIGLVSGEFSNGAGRITVGLRRSVTLVSQPDGFRYTIKLVKLGEAPS